MIKSKIVKEKRDLYIDFTEEEIADMGWEDKQKLSLKVNEDKSITFTPYVKVEIDTSDWEPGVFKMLVDLSLETDKTVNDVISDLLTASLDSDKSCCNKKEQLICE
jgi:hypothetical protein